MKFASLLVVGGCLLLAAIAWTSGLLAQQWWNNSSGYGHLPILTIFGLGVGCTAIMFAHATIFPQTHTELRGA